MTQFKRDAPYGAKNEALTRVQISRRLAIRIEIMLVVQFVQEVLTYFTN